MIAPGIIAAKTAIDNQRVNSLVPTVTGTVNSTGSCNRKKDSLANG